MNVSEIYPSKWLKASDLKGPVIVTIAGVAIVEVGSDREKRPVASFTGKEKQFVMNKTNLRAIADLYGGNTESWHGQKIVLYPTTTPFGGEERACIRVRGPKDFVRLSPSKIETDASAPMPADDMDDEIPF